MFSVAATISGAGKVCGWRAKVDLHPLPPLLGYTKSTNTQQLILHALSLCGLKGTAAWKSSYDTGYRYIPIISESGMVGTVLQQGKYLTHDCIYKMTFVRYELLKYCKQARHMV